MRVSLSMRVGKNDPFLCFATSSVSFLGDLIFSKDLFKKKNNFVWFTAWMIFRRTISEFLSFTVVGKAVPDSMNMFEKKEGDDLCWGRGSSGFISRQ